MFKLYFWLALATLCSAVPTVHHKYYNDSGSVIKCTAYYWTPLINSIEVEHEIVTHLEQHLSTQHWIQVEQTSTDTIYYNCTYTQSDAFEAFKPIFMLLSSIMILWQLIGCLFKP